MKELVQIVGETCNLKNRFYQTIFILLNIDLCASSGRSLNYRPEMLESL